jgi:hypothetical protein
MDHTERMAAALAVGYELRQLADAALRIDSASDVVTKNALLESTLLHARVLIEFLIGRDGNGKDIRADELCPGWLTDATAREDLERRLKAIDQHLAHLSRARVTEGKQVWPYPRIVRELVGHMHRYHKTMKAAGILFAASIGYELARIDTEAPLAWPSETIYTGDLNTGSGRPNPLTFNRTSDPLELFDFVEET